jgi:hypothetical protein
MLMLTLKGIQSVLGQRFEFGDECRGGRERKKGLFRRVFQGFFLARWGLECVSFCSSTFAWEEGTRGIDG